MALFIIWRCGNDTQCGLVEVSRAVNFNGFTRSIGGDAIPHLRAVCQGHITADMRSAPEFVGNQITLYVQAANGSGAAKGGGRINLDMPSYFSVVDQCTFTKNSGSDLKITFAG
ncbi:hypothetical protein RG836_06625 [Pseudomonas sp. SZMC_28357]|uniref:hypothetical protein n=1 Tax=Pseudomonas sp. SZMC_28357 TaxID=3074380 RepID=UPI002871B734|nr:hypothetical protein [Pseudomonas sp. SZMC_28357]MDR9751113.1 hypothetical protein [Pseudomonas sp. SZMC_28357]